MGIAPSEFPPPFNAADYIVPPTDLEEDRIEVGVAIVGGGPAGLACAIRLMQLLDDEPELTCSPAPTCVRRRCGSSSPTSIRASGRSTRR